MATIDDVDFSVDKDEGETRVELWRSYSANDLMQYVPPANNGDENCVADFIYDEMLNDMGYVFRHLWGEGSFPEVDGYDKFEWDWFDIPHGLRIRALVRLDGGDIDVLSEWAKQWGGK